MGAVWLKKCTATKPRNSVAANVVALQSSATRPTYTSRTPRIPDWQWAMKIQGLCGPPSSWAKNLELIMGFLNKR